MSARIRIVGLTMKKGYSGGRLLSMILAEALATQGARVDYLVPVIPEMYDEFRSFSRVDYRAVNFRNLSAHVDTNCEFVIVIPHQGDVEGHAQMVRHALDCSARVVLLNFETPNWFNVVSPYHRDPAVWNGWLLVSQHARLILSISGEGNRYARGFFQNVPEDCQFSFSYPAINNVLADQASRADREKRIILLTRVDPHKGFDALEPLMTKSLEGYQVELYLGNGKLESTVERKLRRQFKKCGIDFRAPGAIKGLAKFELLKRSALLYFPSRFEGFGIPPLEAAYCKLPCACTNLPVLKEYGGDCFVYGDAGNTKTMTDTVLQALDSPKRPVDAWPRMSEIARMDQYGRRLIDILSRI